jgi:predicted nuclease of predicted toxin-antitoxin system
MSVPLVVDMNLTVEWVAELARHGWSAVHWSTVGDPRPEAPLRNRESVSNWPC